MISWNVNGLRAAVGKISRRYSILLMRISFAYRKQSFRKAKSTWNLTAIKAIGTMPKKGYAGTAIFTKEEPKDVFYGINEPFYDNEGRVITLEFENYFFLTCYTPNSQSELKRLEYRMSWEEKFLSYLKKLEKTKPVILCGDLNVAHKEIDLKNPKTNMGNAGFTNEEREKFGTLLDSGFIDTFRYFHPDEPGRYSWWSYRFNARKNNAGWRIDYFLVSEELKDKLVSADILSDIQGSDHCPVELVADI